MSCPCIIQSGKRSGKKCEAAVKSKGKCGRHQKSCVTDVVNKKSKTPLERSSCSKCRRALNQYFESL